MTCCPTASKSDFRRASASPKRLQGAGEDAADIVMWLSQRFLEHKRLKHPTALDPDAADATEPDPPQEQ